MSKQGDWDLTVGAGIHHQFNPSNAVGPYGQAELSYNLGSHFADKHIDKSVAAYQRWKETQQDDVAQQAGILKQQILDTITIDQDQLSVLLQQDKESTTELQSITGIDSTTAIAFRNQIQADQLLLRVDIGDLQFRLTLLRQYLIDNF